MMQHGNQFPKKRKNSQEPFHCSFPALFDIIVAKHKKELFRALGNERLNPADGDIYGKKKLMTKSSTVD